MRRIMLIVVALLLTLPGVAEEWDVKEDLAAAKLVFEKNLDAIRDRDRDTYLSTYLRSDSLARTGPAGISRGYRDLEASAGSGWPDTFEGRDLDLVPIRPGVVYGTYRYRVRYGHDEQTGLSERLFVRTDDGWRIAVTTAFANPPEVTPVPIALVGGTLIDGTGAAPVEDSVVLVREGKIECAGSSEECGITEEYATIDATGRWIAPGLVDAHVHYGQTGWADGRPDSIDVTEKYPYAEVVGELREHPEQIHRALLCSGITSAFDVGGYAWSASLNEPAGTRPVPNLATAGPLLSTVDHQPLNLPGESQIMPMRSVDEAREMVRYIHSLGADAVKVWLVMGEGLDPETVAPLVMAVGEEAKRLEIPLVVHATELSPAKLALRAGASVLVHGVGDQAVDDEFLSMLISNGTVYVPTLVVHRGYERMFRSAATGQAVDLSDPGRCVPASVLARLEETPALESPYPVEVIDQMRSRIETTGKIGRENVMRVIDAGGKVAVGTDAGNPLTLHGPAIFDEIEAMAEAGMSPAQILVAATRNGGLAMGRPDVGTIEKGRSADLLLLERNPLEDSSHWSSIDQIMLRGVLRAQDELERQ